MKTLFTFGIATCLAFALSGCVIVAGDHDWDDNSWKTQQKDNLQMINSLVLKSDRSQVVEKLGAPSFSDAFVKNGEEYRVLFYRTQHVKSDGETTKDETTPLVFKNDKLVGWGDSVLATIK